MLRWASNGSWGPSSLFGFDHSGRLRAQVVRYDRPPGWSAFVAGSPLPGGPWPDAGAACRAVTEALLGR